MQFIIQFSCTNLSAYTKPLLSHRCPQGGIVGQWERCFHFLSVLESESISQRKKGDMNHKRSSVLTQGTFTFGEQNWRREIDGTREKSNETDGETKIPNYHRQNWTNSKSLTSDMDSTIPFINFLIVGVWPRLFWASQWLVLSDFMNEILPSFLSNDVQFPLKAVFFWEYKLIQHSIKIRIIVSFDYSWQSCNNLTEFLHSSFTHIVNYLEHKLMCNCFVI